MTSIYSTSTHHDPIFLHLICGRTEDLQNLLDSLANKQSIALVGTRRIGKTSLLYLLQDIITGEIIDYQKDLLDQDLKNAVLDLSSRVPNRYVVYLNTSRVPDLVFELHRKIQEAGIPIPTDLPWGNPNSHTLREFLELVHKYLAGRSLVLLLDEIDDFPDLEKSDEFFQHLKSVIQGCPNIQLVLAGAEYWESKLRTAPSGANLAVFIIRAPFPVAISRYLIREPLKSYLAPGEPISLVTRTVIDWTACAPLYVQIICDVIVALAQKNKNHLPVDWTDQVERQVRKKAGIHIEEFYESRDQDDKRKLILALLANKPEQNVSEIAHRLNLSKKITRSILDDLEHLGKISVKVKPYPLAGRFLERLHKKEGKYRIAGTLLEKIGQETQDLPIFTSFWIQSRIKLAKWVTALLLTLCILGAYSYTNPIQRSFVFPFNDGEVLLHMPETLEDAESGDVEMSVHNLSATNPFTVTITINSSSIDYQFQNSNLSVWPSIAPGEQPSHALHFLARNAGLGNAFSSEVQITTSNVQAQKPSQTFLIPARVLPIKRFWPFISGLFVIFVTLVVKPDLAKVVIDTVSKLFSK